MRALLTADLHLTDNPRDAYRFEFITELGRIIKREHVGLLLILGDLTEEKDNHGAWLVNRIANDILFLSQLCPVLIMKGNHDYRDVDSPFFEFLSAIKGVTWVGVPTKGRDLPIPPLTKLGRTLFLPHTRDYEQEWAAFNFGRYDWIFTHNTFTGADLGHRQADGIPLDIFPKGANVISGDVHAPQRLGPVTYIGAPYTIDFGDAYNPRLLLIDTNLNKLESIPYKGPQKQLITVSNLDELHKHKGRAGDVVKIKFEVSHKEYTEYWPAISYDATHWARKQGWVLHQVQPVVAGADAKPIKRASEVTKRDDEALIRLYAKRNKLDPKTITTGLNLLKE